MSSLDSLISRAGSLGGGALRGGVLRGGRAWALLLTLFLAMGGCGGGGGTGSNQQQFFFQVIGAAGGTATGGPVSLTFPPGALVGDTSVAILPELNPFPIVPAINDPCVYAYLDDIHCCGPYVLQLQVPGVLRVAYDESLIPPGLTENDLVLLISDPNIDPAIMVPKIGGSVTQYTASNYFEDTNYNPLGHVAIGIRVCPIGGLLVQNNLVSAVQGAALQEGGSEGSNQGTIGLQGLFIVDPNGVNPPAPVETGGVDFDAFLASPSGNRLLLRVSDSQAEVTRLMTVPLPAGGVPSTVFEDDYGTGTFLQAYDPHYGWLAGSSSEEVFCTQYRPLPAEVVQGQGIFPTQVYELLRRDSVALPPPSSMRERDASFFFPDDLRQSTNGSHAMLRWGANFGQGGLTTGAFIDGAVDVITSPGSALVSEGLIPPNGFGGSSPRFMTGSNDLYVVEFNTRVQRYAPDGTFVGTLFDPGFKGEILVDFALAPDDETFAMVFHVPLLIDFVQQGPGGYETVLAMGTLTGGIEATYSFFSQQSVEELVWHPQQTGVFLELSGWSPAFYSLENDKGTYIQETWLPIQSLSQLDVNRLDGRIAIVVTYFRDLVGPTAESIPFGVYVSPSDASDFQLVPMEGLFNPVNVRWIESWRNQPGMGSARVR